MATNMQVHQQVIHSPVSLHEFAGLPPVVHSQAQLILLLSLRVPQVLRLPAALPVQPVLAD
jgi:hypothetical protein